MRENKKRGQRKKRARERTQVFPRSCEGAGGRRSTAGATRRRAHDSADACDTSRRNGLLNLSGNGMKNKKAWPRTQVCTRMSDLALMDSNTGRITRTHTHVHTLYIFVLLSVHFASVVGVGTPTITVIDEDKMVD